MGTLCPSVGKRRWCIPASTALISAASVYWVTIVLVCVSVGSSGRSPLHTPHHTHIQHTILRPPSHPTHP